MNMNKTGTKCSREGMYVSDCIHRSEVTLKLWDIFPSCLEGGEEVAWIFSPPEPPPPLAPPVPTNPPPFSK